MLACRQSPPPPPPPLHTLQDGVLWRGSTLLPGTAEALEALRRRGKRLLFLTNNSSRSRAQYRRKFEALGLQVQPEEIVPARWVGDGLVEGGGCGAQQPSKRSNGVHDHELAAGQSCWE